MEARGTEYSRKTIYQWEIRLYLLTVSVKILALQKLSSRTESPFSLKETYSKVFL
jgi:hypothetical protein